MQVKTSMDFNQKVKTKGVETINDQTKMKNSNTNYMPYGGSPALAVRTNIPLMGKFRVFTKTITRKKKYKNLKDRVIRIMGTLSGIKNNVSELLLIREKERVERNEIFDEYLEQQLEYVLVYEIKDKNLADIPRVKLDIDIEANVLVEFLMETIERLVVIYHDLILPVRIPQFTKNVKNLLIPKYMLYSLILIGTTVVNKHRIPRQLTADVIKMVEDGTSLEMDKNFEKPKLYYLWCYVLLKNYYGVIGAGTKMEAFVEMTAIIAKRMSLNKVDFPRNSLKRESMVITEFKRRMWWCVFLSYHFYLKTTTVLCYFNLKDCFVKLPGGDRAWFRESEEVNGIRLNIYETALLSSKDNWEVDINFMRVRCLISITTTELISFVNRRRTSLVKNFENDFKQFLKLTENSRKLSKRVNEFIMESATRIELCKYKSVPPMSIQEMQRIVLSFWYFQLFIRENMLILAVSEIAHFKVLTTVSPERVRCAKKAAIDLAAEIINLFYWGYSNIPLRDWSPQILSLTVKVGLILINVKYIYDYPEFEKNNERLAFLLRLVDAHKSAILSAKNVNSILLYILKTKAFYNCKNLYVKSIPASIASIAITPGDRDPWFSPSGMTFANDICCLFSDEWAGKNLYTFTCYANFQPVEYIESNPKVYFSKFSEFGDLDLSKYGYADKASALQPIENAQVLSFLCENLSSAIVYGNLAYSEIENAVSDNFKHPNRLQYMISFLSKLSNNSFSFI